AHTHELGGIKDVLPRPFSKRAISRDNVCNQVERVAESMTLRPVPFKLLHARSIESLRSKFVPNSGRIGKLGPVQIQNHHLMVEQLLPFRIPVVFKISGEGNRPVAEAGGRSGDTKILLHSRTCNRLAYEMAS